VKALTHQDGSRYRSELVQNLLVQETRSVATSATAATFADGSSGVWTNYKYARPEGGELGAELAALRVPGITNVPLEIAERDPDNGTELSIFGYSRGNRMLTDGLQEERGRAIAAAGLRSSRTVSTSARVVGGNRGGPVIDSQGVVIGIAFDTPPGGFEEQGLFFGAGELRRWFYHHVQTSQLSDVQLEMPATGRLERVRASTVPVLCWGLERKSEQQIFSDFADNSRSGGGVYLRDGWCVACDGKGVRDCAVSGCNNGVIAGRGSKSLGIDPVSGKERIVPTVVKERCSACSGRGTRPCLHCKGGRI
jgi:hypothetical protein